LKDIRLIGINNRNLATFEVSLEATERLRPMIPENIVVVAESGIFHVSDVERLARAKVNAILVGEALVTAEDIAAKVRELSGLNPSTSSGQAFSVETFKRSNAMTKIKICGIKTVTDALAAMHAGADLIGFNFYPKSPRYIEVGRCRDIMTVMRRYGHIQYVGVFVNASAATICATMETLGLSLAQLHGDETPEMLQELNGKAFKAFRGIPEKIDGFERKDAPAFLVDASVKGLYGGSGVTADWAGAAGLAKRYPLLLAGGLTPQNVAEAVQQVKPWGVDVASGVESEPGMKDAAKMKSFVKAVRGAIWKVESRKL
jgi:phosphoribosylanthranilate isomerase